MVATAVYSVTMVLWNETAFPLCRAMENVETPTISPGVSTASFRWESACLTLILILTRTVHRHIITRAESFVAGVTYFFLSPVQNLLSTRQVCLF